jgi:uncharacterized Rossmann fold enzyme
VAPEDHGERELSPEEVRRQAEVLGDYLAKPDNKGAEFWLDSKGFTDGDRRAILLALSDLEAETP